MNLHGGTGSYPPLQNGLHLSILHTERASPQITPHSLIASIAYLEQVGVKRQHGGFSGDIYFLYSDIIKISAVFIADYLRHWLRHQNLSPIYLLFHCFRLKHTYQLIFPDYLHFFYQTAY